MDVDVAGHERLAAHVDHPGAVRNLDRIGNPHFDDPVVAHDHHPVLDDVGRAGGVVRHVRHRDDAAAGQGDEAARDVARKLDLDLALMRFVAVGRVGQNLLVAVPHRAGSGGHLLGGRADRVGARHERIGHDLHRIGLQAGDFVLQLVGHLLVRVPEAVGLGALVAQRVRNGHGACADQRPCVRRLLLFGLFRLDVVEIVREEDVAHRPVQRRAVRRPRGELAADIGQLPHGDRRGPQVGEHDAGRRRPHLGQFDDEDVLPELDEGAVTLGRKDDEAGGLWQPRLGWRVDVRRIGALAPWVYPPRQVLPLVGVRVCHSRDALAPAHHQVALDVGAVPAERDQPFDRTVGVDPVGIVRREVRDVTRAGG